MAKKYIEAKSGDLVASYIEEKNLNGIVGTIVMLHLMADDTLDTSLYRRLMTSAYAFKERDSTVKRKRRGIQKYTGDRFLFDDMFNGDEDYE